MKKLVILPGLAVTTIPALLLSAATSTTRAPGAIFGFWQGVQMVSSALLGILPWVPRMIVQFLRARTEHSQMGAEEPA